MADSETKLRAGLEVGADGGLTRISPFGIWSISTAAVLEEEVAAAPAAVRGRVVLDLAGITYIDTAGAWLIRRLEDELKAAGATVDRIDGSENALRLLAAVNPTALDAPPRPARRFIPLQLVEMLGQSMTNAASDLFQALGILGGVVRGLLRSFTRPTGFRLTSIVFHLDRSGLQAVPIVFLISFLIGGIIAQQGIFQLRFFGADTFVVDLVGILILREIGVLLTAIMLAGRSGSAYTAEIGSMKMREELDALTVIGLDPNEVLIMPRIVALVIALPLLTFIADMAGLLGGAVVAYIYGNMAFQTFIIELRDAVGMNTLNVGLIKAPFMGLIVGLVAATEGLAVEGSTESLGRRTTSSVVKAIFAVIVADGLFSIFFAAIDY